MFRQRGFTLLEVMIALIIFGLVATGIVKGLSLAANAQQRMQHRTLATMIAQNSLAELRLAGKPPSVGQTKKDLDFAQNEWKTVTRISATEDAKLMRVDVEISRKLKNGELFKELDFTGFVADLN